MAITSVSVGSLAEIFDLPEGTAVSLSGVAAATGLSTSTLANFQGSFWDPFLILSTGIATQVTGANVAGNQGTDLGAGGSSGDTVILSFVIPKPANARAFTFDFVFLSEEFPEYVGSQFNDFLSVTVNGVQAALDTNGRQIEVNNNFFTDEYSPVGTFFDGQTPPLRVNVPIDPAAATVEVVIQLSDVGDGIYDSAAFLKSFQFLEPQIVYLEFDEAFLEFQSFLWFGGFNLPASGLGAAARQQIVDAANKIYDGYLIEFTSVKPTEGDYSTIHVGGSMSDVPAKLRGGYIGLAEQIDEGNEDKSDVAFVLLEEIFELGYGLDLVGQVVAHEAGHILGLRHVAGPLQLMYPYADTSAILIGGDQPLANSDGNGGLAFAGGRQDTRAELERNLGLENSVKLITAESFTEKIKKFFDFDFQSSVPKLYDAKAVVATSDGLIIDVVDLGTIGRGSSANIVVPATEGDHVILLGKSTPGGGYDTFVAPDGLTTFSTSNLTEEAILESLGVSVSQLGSSPLRVVTAAPNGNLTLRGTVETSIVSLSEIGAGEGSDSLRGTAGSDTLPGLAGDDRIAGLGAGDELFGNDGDDRLDGGRGADVLEGGTGDDTYLVDTSADRVIEGSGGGVDTIRSSVGLTLPAFVEKIVLTGSASIDATGNSLANVIVGNGRANTLAGGAGKDTLQGNGGNDVLKGASGDDTLNGGAGADDMAGGLGRDRYVVDSADDTIVEAASAGIDTVQSSIGYSLRPNLENLVLTGTSAVRAIGNGADNDITGNAAGNILDGRGGADIMSGGGGNDTYIADDRGDRAVERSPNGGIDLVESKVGFTLGAFIEHLTLTGNGSIKGVGNGRSNTIIGNGGANELRGGGGADVLKGGAGADSMYGGDGDDSYYVTGNGDRAVETRSTGGIDTVYSTVGFALGTHFENLELTGNSAIDGTGTAVANDIVGNSAVNLLTGGGGADSLKGRGGDDLLRGGPGNDSLNGGDGKDVLKGGGGADLFQFEAVPAAASLDHIRDFETGIDLIGLNNAFFKGIGDFGFRPSCFVVGAAAADADDRIVYDPATGTLYYDRDGSGNGSAVAFAVLDNKPATLTAFDFLVI